MFKSNLFFFNGLLRGRDWAKKNAEVQPELLSLCLCRGRAFTFTGRSSALPAILKHYKGTTFFSFVIQKKWL